ncbi:hypothetical protein HMJ29_07715 [Hymenobacter taeanensis]|uniref:Toxin-antitoxin system YwqK family antitoxin n=1 Tax=Hymenobacter taeanensis TaxID=2735321 RepID=A0A6M6BGD9_9BACT|nr:MULTISPECIES: hypothetical protein [Hymenobacter]QJX46834.1 hypothetical protein HMJ29_07715 [Hymenobacter taeanensis]UOQ80705.1 hypothetical protein MUN83_18065 [Hymenobacter sp. 5414T-23]
MSDLLTSCASWPLSHAHNHHDAKGQRHGRWQEYFDVAEKQLANQGRYRHGRPVGLWRYYNPAQQLERKERFLRVPPQQLAITYYYATGQIAREGKAKYVLRPDGAQFYWFGEWKRYSESGHLQASEYYVKGQLQGKMR